MFEGLFRRSGRIVRLILRQERWKLLIWFVGLVGITVAVPIAFGRMFEAEGGNMFGMMTENPAMIAMVGPTAASPENYTVGAMNVHMMAVFVAIVIAILNIFLVVRHTRGDEELGRQEMIRSLPVGRLSTLGAVLGVAVLVNVLIGVGVGIGLWLLRIESIDFEGSMLYGTSMAAIGMVFAAIAAIFAQLCQTARAAIGWSMAIMIGFYLMRAVGDVDMEILSLISPLGLILRADAAVNNYWWPVFVLLVQAIVLVLIAFWLNSIRDMDQGFIPAKPGRDRASRILVRPMGLSLRLLRFTIIAWGAGLILLGASYGSILGDMESFSDIVVQITGEIADGEDMTKTFVSVLMRILAICAAIPCLIMIFRLRGEEKRGRVEGVLANSVSRGRLFRAYLIPALVFGVIAPVLAVVGLFGASYFGMETPIPFLEMLFAVMVFLPSVVFMVGLAAFLIGFLPKFTSFAWGFLVFSFFVVYMGQMMDLPSFVIHLTPFGHVSQSLIESVNYAPLIVTLVLGLGLIVAGGIGYRRRDMAV